MEKKEAILVTTEYRGIFFGYVKDKSKLPQEITLTLPRNCIYWSEDLEGFIGLSVKGPNDTCTIGCKGIEMTLYKITSTAKVSKEAEKKWMK